MSYDSLNAWIEAQRRAGTWKCEPLATLNDHIRAVSPSTGSRELAGVQRFRRVLAASRTLDRVADSVARKPANAGPLNSHALVLEALGLMQHLSADYLRRFVLHVEALQWLEQAGLPPAPEPKDARKPRARKKPAAH